MTEVADRPSTSATPLIDDEQRNKAGSPTDLEQVADAIRSHRLYPMLQLLLSKCELVTADLFTAGKHNDDVTLLHECRQTMAPCIDADTASTQSAEIDVDVFMMSTVRELRCQLSELARVDELCHDFCRRFTLAIRQRLQTEILANCGGDSDCDDDNGEMSSAAMFSAADNGEHTAGSDTACLCFDADCKSLPPMQTFLSRRFDRCLCLRRH